MRHEKSFKDMLSNALKMEEKGYEFYKTQTAKSKNKIAKDMFTFLADNELYHIESIKKFYINIDNDKLATVAGLSEKDSRISDLDIFHKKIGQLDEKISPDGNDKEACEFAMEFEKDGYDYYKKMLEQADSGQAIKFLEFLIEEEKRHYEIIEKTYNYLTDSANWFMYEEGSFPQG